MQAPAKDLFVLLSSRIPAKTAPKREAQEVIQWVPVATCHTHSGPFQTGVSADGFWANEYKNGMFVIDREKNYFSLVAMMERPMQDVLDEIRKAPELRDIAEQVAEAFPFAAIAREGFRHKRPHWIEMAFQWLDEFSHEQRAFLAHDLEEIRQTKLVSQKHRHRAQKELAKLKRERQLLAHQRDDN